MLLDGTQPLVTVGEGAHGFERSVDEPTAGHEWLVEEPDPADVLAGSYRRVEHHLPSGTMLVCIIEASTRGAVTYVLEVVPGGGPVDGPLEPVRTFVDRDEWLRAAEQHRSAISARP